MAIVAGLDVHRNQITFDALDIETGELSVGRIRSTREAVRGWVGRFPRQQRKRGVLRKLAGPYTILDEWMREL